MYFSPCVLALVLIIAGGPHTVGREGRAAPAAADTTLVGLWGAEESYGPVVRGPLTVARVGGEWEARVAGFDVTPRVARDSIWIELPDGTGWFRGRIRPDGAAIDGFWIQPAGVVSGVRYASPLRLGTVPSAAGAHAWRGTVVPLDEQFSLYLIVTRRADGSLAGSFHNPEANSRGGAALFTIERSGSTVRFTDTTRAPGAGAPPITAMYDTARQQLVVPWALIGRPIVLTRRTRNDAVGLYPRVPGGTAYRYRQPPADHDGWITARASAAGFEEDRLAALVQHIAAGDPSADTTPLIHSVLIARHGKLVLEEYFFGFDRWRQHDLRSASKTFASVLVGAAMMHGAPLRPSSPVYAFFPADTPVAHPDPRKAQITLAQLLTHSTGLACDDNGADQPGNEDTMQSQQEQPDWYRYTLDLPVIYDPGEHYAYCSATMNLVGGVVAATEHAWLPALFDEWVASPLELQPYYVNLMPGGEAYFGGGMYLVPRDFLKLGVTYLNGGVWNGRRIVARSWAERSTAQQKVAAPAAADGYAWHLNMLTYGGRSVREYEANGNGGQFLIVLPDLDLAVVFTGGDYNRYRVWRQWRDVLVPQYILAAVMGPKP